jgi:hypothetical protein
MPKESISDTRASSLHLSGRDGIVKAFTNSRPSCVISGTLLVLAVAFGSSACQDMVWVSPEDGTVQQGPFDVQVYWSPGMVPSTLQVSLNNEEISGSMSPATRASSGEVEIAGVLGLQINPFPGGKLLSAQMKDSNGLPYAATSIFTATSATSRTGFDGGAMVFECTDSFLNSPLQLPGVDMDLGISEMICKVLPITGLFPAGSSDFPVSSDPFPLLFGIFPKQVTFDEDDAIPNGISLSPVELGLSFGFDPADPGEEGKVCHASFVMKGTVLPVQPAIADQYHAAMIQSLREVSLSVVSGGTCEEQFTSSGDVDIMTFNYLAGK